MGVRASVALLGCLLLGAWGCSDDCACPLGTTCASDGSCVGGCSSDADCPSFSCDDEDPCCSERGVCSAGRCAPERIEEERCGPPPEIPQGWSDLPGDGVTFVFNSAGILREAVVDVDGRCGPRGCADNKLAPIRELVNDQLRQSLLGGELLYALEIAGLDPDYNGFDRSVTLKIYPTQDFDDPFFTANNFRKPPGHTECCMFVPRAEGLAEATGVAKIRIPAQIIRGEIVTVEPQTVELVVPKVFSDEPEDPPFHTVWFELGQLSASLPRDLSQLDDVIFSGAVRVSSLATICNPFCKSTSPRCPSTMPEASSILDLVMAVAGQPDIDLDGDGLECLFDAAGTGNVDRCCDGAPACDLQSCLQIDPPDPARSCAQSPQLADGHSISFFFTGVPATLR